jgi:diguanylate cyclase (GGDEF)-like protein
MIQGTSITRQAGPRGLAFLIRAWRSFRTERTAQRSGEGFTRAYAENLSHRLPLLYCVVLFDTAVLMASFYGVAPTILVLWLPLPFIALGCRRAAYWLPHKVMRRPLDVLSQDIRRLSAIGTAFSLVPMCWSIALYRYGNESQQSLVHYITAVTCFTGILSLGQAPRTAIRMAIVVMLPTSLFFLLQDHPNRFGIVAVQIVVTLLLLLITAGYHDDFVGLEHSRQELSRREQESARLAEANRLNASRDPLTGANNRRAILALFEQALADPTKPAPWLALVDLDNFKLINDTYGHAAGDAVLCEVARLIEGVAEIDAFGRLGGDEFAILISGALSLPTVSTALDSLSLSISQPIDLEDLKLSVRGSIGLHQCSGTDLGECMERADSALYKAKEDRNGAVARFTKADERAMCERRDAIRVFTSANLAEQLALVYQPIVDSDLGRPVAFEALVRWSPDGINWLPPAAFINLAETTGRIGELTRHVLGMALNECRVWDWGCSLAINLSARDILRDNAADWIGGIVAAAGAPPRKIILEITETALLSDYRRAADTLEKLRNSGYRIALDDFGTGQSSLSHVHNLPLDHLKIDQSFARDLVQNEGSQAIVSTVMALARQLRLDCTIEGIEKLEQQAVARSLGVRMMQGYYFGRPIKAAEVLRGLDSNRSANVA